MNLRSRVLAYTAMAGLGLALVSCQPAPGPISVDETCDSIYYPKWKLYFC